MDLLFAGFQGLGLAFATGALLGAAGRRDSFGSALLVVAVLIGAFLYGLALAQADHPQWPGWPIGGLAAALGYVVARDVSAGARTRAAAGATVAAIIALAALLTAGLSWLVPPFAPFALLAAAWLLISRRRRAARKHAGLRTLR